MMLCMVDEPKVYERLRYTQTTVGQISWSVYRQAILLAFGQLTLGARE